MTRLIFFTHRNFNKSGGGSIRISGVLNGLADLDVAVTLISDFQSIPLLDRRIEVLQLPNNLPSINKRFFQFMVSNAPNFINRVVFYRYLSTISKFFKCSNLDTSNIVFFEYLDNSIGYFLKRNGVIQSYINDIHGIVPIEFTPVETDGLVRRIILKAKHISGEKLDKKVFSSAAGFIFPSPGIREYFLNLYPDCQKKKNATVPEAINTLLLEQKIDKKLRSELIGRYQISKSNQVFFFAGDFKPFGGILDLVKAFIEVAKQADCENLKLLLIGEGYDYVQAKSMAANSLVFNQIYFLGCVPYSKLATYQSISDIIVCPDRDGIYSDMLPHIKYFDSLASGKIVINGKFTFTRTLNPDEIYSLNFVPSNVDSLIATMNRALDDFDYLKTKYANNSLLAKKQFSYNESVKSILGLTG